MRLALYCLRFLLLGLVLLHTGLGASELADRLKSNHVLLMRHAYAPGVGDPEGYSLDRCETQRVLNDQGRRQSDRIGQWLRSQGVIQAQVFSSPWCRCKETAELLNLGPVQVEYALASFFDQPEQAEARNKSLKEFIARQLANPKRLPLVLVTHHVNIYELVGKNIGSGDMVLAQLDAKGEVLGFELYPSP